MNLIYEPNGAAAEYADLALNLYSGCGHRCRYCYAPACLRMSRERFGKPKPRKDVLEKLMKDVVTLIRKGETRPILLSFTSDPYQPIEDEHKITRRAITLLGEARQTMRVLTKNGDLALRDLDLFKKYNVEVGVSACWLDDAGRQEWEPGAGTMARRWALLDQAHDAGLRTWVSIEPVIDTAQALGVINTWCPVVTTFKVGKLNHDKKSEAAVDWRKFLADVLERLTLLGCDYYIKKDLWEFADDEIRGKYQRERAAA